MASSERKHHRRSIRLRGYDYTQTCAYFVTLCTQGRELLLGKVADQAMVLNVCGQIAQEEWLASEAIRQEIELDAFVIMPNHLHGIVWIVNTTDSVGATGLVGATGEGATGEGATGEEATGVGATGEGRRV